MPNPSYDYLQQHPLIEIINIHWGEEDVTLNWAWFFEPIAGSFSGGNPDRTCSPPSFLRNGLLQVTGHMVGLHTEGVAHNPSDDWDVIGAPSNPGDVSVGALLYEAIWFGNSGIAFLTGPFFDGQNAGSAVVPVWGTTLNAVEGCYFRPDGNPDVGEWGIGLPPNTGPPNASNTGVTTSFSWPALVLKHKESGVEWSKSRWHVSVAFRTIQLQVTWLESEQGE